MGNRLFDRAMFWIAVAAALGTIGGIIVGVTVARDTQTALTSDPWFLGGAALVGLAILALVWAIILNLAHGHAAGHAAGHAEGEAGGKKARKEIAQLRLAVDTLITWFYREDNAGPGLSENAVQREPAQQSYGQDMYRDLGLSGTFAPKGPIPQRPVFEGARRAAEKRLNDGKTAIRNVIADANALRAEIEAITNEEADQEASRVERINAWYAAAQAAVAEHAPDSLEVFQADRTFNRFIRSGHPQWATNLTHWLDDRNQRLAAILANLR